MSDAPAEVQPLLRKAGLFKDILLNLPMMLLTAMMLTGGQAPGDLLHRTTLAVTFIFVNLLFFLMVRTGKTHKYRSSLFIIIAVCFVISFVSNLIEVRGSMVLTAEDMYSGETPFCHLVIPMIIIPAALTRTIIFPGSMLEGFASIASMIVLWTGASLVLGRAWCSWVCFFGGMDEGFSRLCRRPVIKRIDRKWTYLPYAVLLAVVLTSALTLSPTYCEWLCPFKAVTEFVEINSFKVMVQTVIFVSLFVGLVVVLPALTRRRIQCGLFCPFAAFQSLTNKINVFDVRIDRDKCNLCKRCINACPTFSLDEQSVRNGRTCLSCTKCGQCVDNCPQQAASFHIKGTPVAVGGKARMLFLYPAFLFAVIIGGGMISDALARIIKLISTGSMIH
ncbi:MAG: 4Fe-4S binding protein [Bacillota bacterium]